MVNNAGQGDRVSLEDTTIEVFRRQVETNFLGAVYVTKAAVPILREQGGGRIIQVSSLGGRIGSPGMTAYQSAKWALGGFSEALAAEVAPLGIKVTVIEPGGMRTDWAGASMTTPSPSAPYQDTVGASARAMAGFEHVANSDPGGRGDDQVVGSPWPPLVAYNDQQLGVGSRDAGVVVDDRDRASDFFYELLAVGSVGVISK